MSRALALPLLALLVACSSEAPTEPAPTPTPTVTEPRTLVAADFDPADLGARIEGSVVTDAPIGDPDEPLAKLTAYVACAEEVAVCDPAVLPPGTDYTYVLTITPVAPEEPATRATSAASSPPLPLVVPATPMLAMRSPAPGFDGAVGYSLSEAAAALGAEDAISISLNQGRIVWRVGEGARWQPDKPITFWWQSARPPAEPSVAYDFASGGDNAEVTAPFPAADEPADGAPPR